MLTSASGPVEISAFFRVEITREVMLVIRAEWNELSMQIEHDRIKTGVSVKRTYVRWLNLYSPIFIHNSDVSHRKNGLFSTN